ncbi:Gfo/Idh/MocA family protein [Virgibacillus pantothenticus]|uniref:Gfo/Idh/MocA family protein n=1 Tax=Virgibacillus pantothenticus TaxID=1473 RepID=UPI0009861902|nr:Gfo/Idh/MocA family oxidoreductase [Virgibacillus pantothenticus]
MKIGIMSMAHMHAHSYIKALKAIPHVEVAGIFDDNQQRGAAAANTYQTVHFIDQDAFLQLEMDAVIICSENYRHKEMVVQAAKAKKHILCEKPIATKVEDALEMINTCNYHQVILQIAFPVRFSAPIRELKQQIDNGELGEIIAFRTTNRGQNPGGWFIDEQKSGGGAVLDHTVHMVDIMRWYSGEEVSEVRAFVDSSFHNIGIDDMGLLTLGFKNGIIASHDPSWSRFPEYPTWGDVTIEVIGTKKTVKVDALQEHVRLYQHGDKPLRQAFYGNNMDYALINDFLDCVKTNRSPSVTGMDGLKAMEVALAAYESNRKQETVNLSCI